MVDGASKGPSIAQEPACIRLKAHCASGSGTCIFRAHLHRLQLNHLRDPAEESLSTQRRSPAYPCVWNPNDVAHISGLPSTATASSTPHFSITARQRCLDITLQATMRRFSTIILIQMQLLRPVCTMEPRCQGRYKIPLMELQAFPRTHSSLDWPARSYSTQSRKCSHSLAKCTRTSRDH